MNLTLTPLEYSKTFEWGDLRRHAMEAYCERASCLANEPMTMEQLQHLLDVVMKAMKPPQ